MAIPVGERRHLTAATGISNGVAGRLSFRRVTLSKSSERPGERQLVAVRIAHVEIAFSP